MKQSWQINDPKFQSDKLDASLNITPWSTNRRFACDLVAFLEPENIVELGSHYGCSLFCFAQVVKDKKLPTKIYGIDTWQGDEQAGFYGEEIIRRVKNIQKQQFAGQKITLIREFFRDALPRFTDKSIELIHIDGLHTYEAVKDDFETWLPKLGEEGVILFHDIAGEAKKKRYGSVRHWAELKKQYPSLEMTHNWGLGILFPKGDSKLKVLRQQGVDRLIKLYEQLSMWELYKNRLEVDLAWQRGQTDKWWKGLASCEEKSKHEIWLLGNETKRLQKESAWHKKNEDKWWAELQKLKGKRNDR
jgi:predicted O-methyltransferase YrrM